MSRLKKLANVEELNEMNMPSNVLNTIIQVENANDTVNTVVYRRLMNNNTKFIVEIWELAGQKYVVFHGRFQGQWTNENIHMSEIFESLNEAQLYVQSNLQGEAEVNELVVSKRLKGNFRKLLAAGKEPDYQEISKGFQKEVNIPEVEMQHKDHLNSYYNEWVNYMKRYYPEWAQYPAYIWRGWGYFTDSVTKEEPAEDNKEQQNNEVVDNTPVVNDMSMDMGGDSQ